MTEAAPMYVYATEMVKNYYSILKLKDKRVLTICGSGDQVLNAYLFEAKEVISFDINERAEFITRLKIEAIKILSYEDFLNFFGDGRKEGTFSFVMYKKIREKLPNKIRKYFDMLYKKHKFDGKKLIKDEMFFRQRTELYNLIKEINFYLKDEKNYLKLRSLLYKIKFKFIRFNLLNDDLNKFLDEKFDVINLSNVPNYLYGHIRREGVRHPFKGIYKIFNNLMRIINTKGVVFYYGYTKKMYPIIIAKSLPPPCKNSNIFRMRKVLKIKIIQKNFKSISGKGFDKIVILSK